MASEFITVNDFKKSNKKDYTTKLTFRVKDRDGGYIEGWQELQLLRMGVMNDPHDKTKLSICFFDAPDDYYKIEPVTDNDNRMISKDKVISVLKTANFHKYEDMTNCLNELGLE